MAISTTPWCVTFNGASLKVVDADGKAVCMVTPRKGQWNAPLLAAAPDLLKTLRLCERALEGRDAEAAAHAAKQARAIIEDLEGEHQ